MTDQQKPQPASAEQEPLRVEAFRKALMEAHAHDWTMETISEAAHICAMSVPAPGAQAQEVRAWEHTDAAGATFVTCGKKNPMLLAPPPGLTSKPLYLSAPAQEDARLGRVRYLLENIREYWNGNENLRAMADALHHIDVVAAEALALLSDATVPGAPPDAKPAREGGK